MSNLNLDFINVTNFYIENGFNHFEIENFKKRYKESLLLLDSLAYVIYYLKKHISSELITKRKILIEINKEYYKILLQINKKDYL